MIRLETLPCVGGGCGVGCWTVGAGVWGSTGAVASFVGIVVRGVVRVPHVVCAVSIGGSDYKTLDRALHILSVLSMAPVGLVSAVRGRRKVDGLHINNGFWTSAAGVVLDLCEEDTFVSRGTRPPG